MKFYSVDWWDPNLGPMRAHFATRRQAVRAARGIGASDMEISVDCHWMDNSRDTMLLALDRASNLGSEGLTGYPGETAAVLRILPKGQR
jgi:hypothetical protein